MKKDWFTVVYIEDIIKSIVAFLFIACIVGITDGLLENMNLEGFLWAGAFTFGFVLFLFMIFRNIRISLGLTSVFFGSFLGLMQTIFYFIYGIMRQFPQEQIPGKLWIIPGVVWTWPEFWLSMIVGYVMMIMGFMLIRGVKNGK